MTQKYFGTDGIRGRVGVFPMTVDIALKVSKAAAHVLKMQKSADFANRVIIGKDTRLSGYMFEEAMAAGFVSMGIDVVLAGPIPTPAVAMLTKALGADIGVMISASHNPYHDNGIKLFGADGYKLDDDLEMQIEQAIDADLSVYGAPSAEVGKASRLEDALERYGAFIKQSLAVDFNLDGLKLVVDCAHGAAYKCAPQVLRELGADVYAIGVDPDGRNINDEYGATATGNLERAVVERAADLGIALDGDADRLILVDETGCKIDGDQLMAALALDWQKKGKLKGGGLVATVMSNLGLERLLAAQGLTLHRTAVGDRNVVEFMRAHDFNLGGEQSGHLVMSEHATTGDGLLAALQILVILRERSDPASKTLHLFSPAPQILKNVRIAGGPVLNVPEVAEAVRQAEKNLDGRGRLLVRPSGTEPLIRVMAEGDDENLINSVVSNLCDVIEKAAKTA